MEKTISLYEMANDLIELIEIEEINEETKAQLLEAIEGTIEAKAENIIAVVKQYEARIEAIKTEERRLAEYRAMQETKVKKLEEYTLFCLEKMKINKLETNLGRISTRKKPASLEVMNEDLVPNEYKKEITTIKIDKVQIKKDLKEKQIEGVRLIESGNSLVIK